jgi:thymidylate synthase (FAD)
VGSDSLSLNRPSEGLINYLMRDRHGSPFEHGSLTFYIEAPIFVAREFFRHRAGWSYNEESGRYRELRPVFYVPSPQRNLQQVGKPGAYTFEPGTPAQYAAVTASAKDSYQSAWHAYQNQLQAGVAKEVARNVLPVGIFTSFWATCNPRSLMHFLSLRTTDEGSKFPSFPQREIEMVAEKMEDYFHHDMPLTWQAFHDAGRVAP